MVIYFACHGNKSGSSMALEDALSNSLKLAHNWWASMNLASFQMRGTSLSLQAQAHSPLTGHLVRLVADPALSCLDIQEIGVL